MAGRGPLRENSRWARLLPEGRECACAVERGSPGTARCSASLVTLWSEGRSASGGAVLMLLGAARDERASLSGSDGSAVG